MEREVVEVQRPVGATYAQPLAGLRVSWGAILAGAGATTAVAVLLWALAFAIILTATHTSLASLGGSTLALWICAIATAQPLRARPRARATRKTLATLRRVR